MKLKKDAARILIMVVIIWITIFSTQMFATNDVKNDEQTEKTSTEEKTETKSTQNNTKTTTTTKKKTETKKSSDANIKALNISDGKLTPDFDKNITEYYTEVDLSVSKITTRVTLSDEKATVTVSGNKNLKEGKNTIELTVTAENGTQKKYYIYATRKEDTEKTNTKLSKLEISGYAMSPSFNPEILEYKVVLTEDIEKLEINVTTENENAKVEITGNDDLKGENNEIKIKVTAEDKTTTQTYTIKVEKKQNKDEDENKVIVKEENKKPAIIAIGVILVIIIILIIKIRINNKR